MAIRIVVTHGCGGEGSKLGGGMRKASLGSSTALDFDMDSGCMCLHFLKAFKLNNFPCMYFN